MQDMYEMLPPRYRTRDGIHMLAAAAREEYADAYLAAQDSVATVRPDTVRVTRCWRNVSADELEFQPMLEVRARFAAVHYVMPCLVLNGNGWGAGKEPKGLERDGAPWVFAGERQGIPACTLSEDDAHVLALFASDEDERSLRASCSMTRGADGVMTHRIIYPFVEEPLTYSARDEYAPPLEEYVRLRPGEEFVVHAYIYCAAPRWPGFGMAGLENAALELLAHDVPEPLAEDELWRRGVAYARRLLTEIDGRRLFAIGLTPDEGGSFSTVRHFEFGWCGQNGMYARMLICDYLAGGGREQLDAALEVLDAWAGVVGPQGLPHVHYERSLDGAQPVDLCNLGFYAWEMLRSYRLLRHAGVDRPRYLEAARGVCDFFRGHFSQEYGFGKSWDVLTGRVVDKGGTIGAYMIPALVQMSVEMRDGSYLDCARRAYDFYYERDLSAFACTAGALDTVCIDKETSGSLVMGGLMLYDVTGERIWLERAEMAAYYFSAWMFYYNARYPEDSDFAREGYRTAGGTMVSTQHHHIDPWGALLAPWYERLAEQTGDARWAERALLMWANACQCVSDGNTQLHGRLRPLGAQNEAYYNCRWHTERAGTLNDWLVAWPGAYRLSAICERARLKQGLGIGT